MRLIKMSKKILYGLVLATLLMGLIPMVSAQTGISITSPSGQTFSKGATVTISAVTYSGDSVWTIQIQRSSTVVWIDQVTGGSLSYSFVIPSTWSGGTYTIYVDGDNSAPVSTTFKIPTSFIPPPPPPPPAPPTASDIETMPTSEAVETIEGMDVEEAADIMADLTPETAADIVDELDTDDAVEIFEEGIAEGDLEEFADIANEADPEVVADILLEMEPEAGADLVEEMVSDDVNAAALRVEEAVKRSGNSEILAEFGGTLEGVPAETLISLFREIVGLPATPSTVAELFEVMDITKVIDIIDGWMATEDYEGLAMVFSYLSDAKLEELFLSMTPEDRTTLYPYLDEVSQAKLPDVGEFTVSDLSITPSTVETGDPVTISVEVSNDGLLQFSEGITLKVDGTSVETEMLTLMPGDSETVTWTLSRATAGTYDVEVNGLTGSFTVEEPEPEPEPANIVYHSVAVSPSSVEVGDPVTVTVTLDNTGELIGTETVELYVNDVLDDSDTTTIVGGGTGTVTFQVTKDTAGTYTVEAGGETATFTVTEPEPVPTRFPLTYALVGVVIIAAAAYMYMQQQQKL
jgi:hypothetical protein